MVTAGCIIFANLTNLFICVAVYLHRLSRRRLRGKKGKEKKSPYKLYLAFSLMGRQDNILIVHSSVSVIL